jgi:hypothetical protein
MKAIENYLEYVLTNIITDVETFAKIYEYYQYLSWLVIWFFWLIWIIIKYTLLTLPIWLPINKIFGRNEPILNLQPIVNTIKKYKKQS